MWRDAGGSVNKTLRKEGLKKLRGDRARAREGGDTER